MIPLSILPLLLIGRIVTDTRNYVSLDAPLMEAGIDSLGASEVTRALGEALGVEVPGTLLFDHPSIGGIASMLGREVAAAGPGSAAPGLHQSVFTKPETRPPQPRIA